MNQKSFERTMSLLHSWNHLGINLNAEPAILIGKVPHAGSAAWMHKIYAPLNDREIHTLQGNLDFELPNDLVQLYKNANGLNLFSDLFSIWGLRTNFNRSSEIHLPYNLISHSGKARLDFNPNWFCFGSSEKNENNLFYDFSKKDNRIYETKRDFPEIIQSWDSLEHFLISEIEKYNALHDETGRMPGRRYITDIMREIEEEKKRKEKKET
jgi:hypothetical protein